MAEQTTAQKQLFEQYQIFENAFLGGVRAWNSMVTATTEITFDMAQKNLQYGQQLRSQADRNVEDTIVAYRKLYEDGLKTWQSYVTDVNAALIHSMDALKN